MKNILALAASTSKKSINKQLTNHVSEQISEAKIIVLDLNDLNLPIDQDISSAYWMFNILWVIKA